MDNSSVQTCRFADCRQVSCNVTLICGDVGGCDICKQNRFCFAELLCIGSVFGKFFQLRQ